MEQKNNQKETVINITTYNSKYKGKIPSLWKRSPSFAAALLPPCLNLMFRSPHRCHSAPSPPTSWSSGNHLYHESIHAFNNLSAKLTQRFLTGFLRTFHSKSPKCTFLQIQRPDEIDHSPTYLLFTTWCRHTINFTVQISKYYRHSMIIMYINVTAKLWSYLLILKVADSLGLLFDRSQNS